MTLHFKTAKDLTSFLMHVKYVQEIDTAYDFRIIGNTIKVLNKKYSRSRLELWATLAQVEVS